MRLTVMMATALLAFAPVPSLALPTTGDAPITNGRVIEVAVHCGPHAHYIHGHRAKDGQWIKGRCIRDHH